MVKLQCEIQYDIHLGTFSAFPFPCLPDFFFLCAFHIKVFRQWETGILLSMKWRCGFCYHPCLLFFNSTLSFGLSGPDVEDTGELRIHKVKEILCFVLCPIASNSQLCIRFVDGC